MKKVLVVGGAGYIGSYLCSFLLKKNYEITSYDYFIYNNEYSLKKLNELKKFKSKRFNIKKKLKKKEINNYNLVILLAGLVGDPITKKYKKYSRISNILGVKNIINIFKNKNVRFIFVSTCSNYGFLKNKIADEKTKLNPISLYAKQKVKIEKYILSLKNKSKFKPIILRFSTAFGLSHRPRFDLTINEFVLRAFLREKIDIFDQQTWRPYCHVKDFANVIYKCLKIEDKKIFFEIFNIGSNKNNYRKIDIVRKIKKYLPYFNYRIVKYSKDPRDYRVDFTKLTKKLGIKSFFSIDYGIKEIINFLKSEKKPSKYLSYGNFRIKKL